MEEDDEPEVFHNQMAHDHQHPFKDLHLTDDDSYTVYVQQNVPLRDGTFVIHQTGNVEFLVKQLQFVEKKKFFLTDFQFGLRGKFKANDATEEDIKAVRAADEKAEQREIRLRGKELVDKQEAYHRAEYDNQEVFQEVFRKRRKGASTPKPKKKLKLDLPAAAGPKENFTPRVYDARGRKIRRLKRKLDVEDDYGMSDAGKVNKYPLLEDCLQGIEQSVSNILQKLKDFFARENKNPEKKQRCYLTLCHRMLDTGIKIGNFFLESEDLPRVADILTTRLSNFINSGEYLHLDLPLDDSFQVRFLMVGQDRINMRKKSKEGYPAVSLRLCEERGVVTGNGRKTPSNAILHTPVGYYGNSEAFKDQCLLVSIILGAWLNEASESGRVWTSRDKKVTTFFKRKALMSESLGQELSTEIDVLCDHIQVARSSPKTMAICDQIATMYSVQIICLSDTTPPEVLGIFPRGPPNFNIPHIYLFFTRRGSSNHVQLISQIQTFQNSRGFVCFGCTHTVPHYINYRHFCKTIPSCRVCRRFLLTPDTYVDSRTQSLFCDSKLQPNVFKAEKCSICGLVMHSKSCKKAHSSRFCKLNFIVCKKCGKTDRGLAAIGNEKPEIGHICSSTGHSLNTIKKCVSCQALHRFDEAHLCLWKAPQKYQEQKNLAFLNFRYSSMTQPCSSCESSSEASISCTTHPFGPVQEIKPVLASVLYEDEYHEKFSLINFYHPSFNQVSSTVRKHCFAFKYMPDGLGLDKSLSRCKETFQFKKPAGKNKHLQENLAFLREKDDKSLEEQLLSTFLCEQYRNFTFVCTERKAIDFLVRALVANNIIPIITVQGSQTILLTVPLFSLTFICLSKFLPGTVEKLQKTFNISENILYFPNIPFNDSKKEDIQCPAFTYFQDVMDNEENAKEKYSFWTEIRRLPFNYLKSLQAVSERDLWIYAKSGLQFAKLSMDLQADCLKNFVKPALAPAGGRNEVPVVSAFTFVSPSSFVMSTFRGFALPDNKLHVVKNQYGKKKPISYVEHQAVEFLRFKQPNQWVTVYSSSEGQKKFYLKEGEREFCIADAYNPTTKTCFMFCGCYHHAHPKCHMASNSDGNKYKILLTQITNLLTYCSKEVQYVSILWECQYSQIKKPMVEHCDVFDDGPLMSPFEELRSSNAELLDFLAGPHFRPFRGMVIRDAMRPSQCEVYALKYVKQAGDGKKCHILDIASLFPYVGINFPLPCGRYIKLLGDELNEIDFDPEFTTMRHKGMNVIAIVHARVFPPTDLFFPFLQTKITKKENKDIIVNTLCRTCSEESSQFEGMTICSHSKMQRSFDGVYTSQELAYGKSLGYNYEFYEMAVYYEQGFFLSKFLTLLGYYKLRHCEYPDSVGKSESERADYCKQLSAKMQFQEHLGYELTPGQIKPDKKLREVYKIFLNSFLGSFGANQTKNVTVKFLESHKQLQSYLEDEKVTIMDIDYMSESMVRVTKRADPLKLKPSRTSNVSVACSITAVARIVVHKHLQKLLDMKATVLRVACDSITFVLDENQEQPFEISEAFGSFKKEFPEVEGVAQAGTQLASVLYRDKEGMLKEKVTASGATMSQLNSSVLCHASFEQMAEKLVKTNIVDFSDIKVDAVMHRTYPKKKLTKLIHRKKTVFSRNLFARRQILAKTPNYLTYPYGWRSTSVNRQA